MNTIPMSPEVELHTRLFERIDHLEVENQWLRSAWVSIEKRFAYMRDARGRWAIAGFAFGVIVTLVLDGSVARWLS